jgi:hypothetical protein
MRLAWRQTRAAFEIISLVSARGRSQRTSKRSPGKFQKPDVFQGKGLVRRFERIITSWRANCLGCPERHRKTKKIPGNFAYAAASLGVLAIVQHQSLRRLARSSGGKSAAPRARQGGEAMFKAGLMIGLFAGVIACMHLSAVYITSLQKLAKSGGD